jgi:oligopeptide/dipeptide ABC transporter ATP-binding protein
MRQRVMIAMALSCKPKLLIADEPTTALDVTIQAQILELLGELRKKLGMSILIITHDLGVVAELAEQILVMYAGKIVEHAETKTLFAEPLHPYTRGLLQSVPSYGENAKKKRLPTIPGVVPDLMRLGEGCRFRERCPDAVDVCATKEPDLLDVGGRLVACFVAQQKKDEAA